MRGTRGFGGFGLAALAAVVVASTACTSTPPPLAAHNLERPSDIAFACVGLLPGGGVADAGGTGGAPMVSGLPMDQCNVPGQFDPPFNTSRRTFAFVANSARGELSVLDLNNSKLIDLDLANPETNVAPLGVLPEQMSASSDGCRIVTANRGSCDLTLVDVSTLMSPELALEGKVTVDSTGPSTVAQEIVVRGGTTGKPLRLNPQEIKFLPQDTSAIFERSKILRTSNPTSSQLSTGNLCSRDRPHADPIGWNATPTDPVETQWKALVTYPTCNLVALVDLPSGNILDSVKVNVGADGVSIALEPTGSDPDCPVEDFCDGRTPPAVASPDGGADGSVGDGSAPDASAPSTAVSSDPFVNPTGVRPGSMAILPDGKRAYVGLAQAAFVAAIDVLPNHLAIPSTGGSIKLHENALGANVVRLSVDPFQGGADGQLGGFVPADNNLQRQYLYVVARDGTVRVVNVSPRTQLLPETECDVNIDPRFVAINSNDPLIPDRTNMCWPTEPPDLAHRRPFARGPGITFPSLPRDVRVRPHRERRGLRGQHRSDAAHAAGARRRRDALAAARGAAAGQLVARSEHDHVHVQPGSVGRSGARRSRADGTGAGTADLGDQHLVTRRQRHEHHQHAAADVHLLPAAGLLAEHTQPHHPVRLGLGAADDPTSTPDLEHSLGRRRLRAQLLGAAQD
jgi:hypothetical protein